jgi:hypothetical protein
MLLVVWAVGPFNNQDYEVILVGWSAYMVDISNIKVTLTLGPKNFF